VLASNLAQHTARADAKDGAAGQRFIRWLRAALDDPASQQPERAYSPSGWAEHMGCQPRIAEGAAWVEPLDQADEVGQSLVERGDGCHPGSEQLAPVGPHG